MRIAPIHQKATPAVGVPIMKAAGTGKAILMAVAGLVLVGGAVGAAMLASQRVQQLMTAGDASPLEGAQASFADLLDNLRKQTLSQARMLVDDTRIRATVITPSFDEATVRDVLEDLRTASQSTGLAVLDSGGKPLAVSGIAALKGVDLSSSAAVRIAQDRATVDVWTVGQQVLVVALAPVRNRREVPALLLVANELPAAALTGIAKAHRVSAALVVAEKLAMRTPGDAEPEALQAAVAQAGAAGEVTIADQVYRYRTSVTGDAATAAQVLWLSSNHHLVAAAGPVRSLVWMPVVMAGLLWLLMVTVVRALVRR
jgi:hypothetical protein